MEIKKFDDFELYVSSRILGVLGDDYKDAIVEVYDVVKNNDKILRGLTIKQRNTTVAPTIYLNDFYEQFKKGKELDIVMNDIADLRRAHEYKGNFDVNFVANWETVKDRVVPKIVNRDLNEQLLRNRVYKELEDLAIIYYVLVDSNEDGQAAIAVTSELFRKWDISFSSLHDTAVINMTKLTPGNVKGMLEVLAGILGEDYVDGMLPIDDTLYVLSNSTMVNGAAAILDDDLMKNTFDRLGRFFVIPSSIHEAILVPVRSGMSIEEIEDMIHQVNTTELRAEDILSERLYVYDPEFGFKIASDELLQMSA